jgi:xanthine dehydrogenase accessory factor
MRDVLPDIDRWLAEGKQVALATVISTWGSAPRPVGSKMAVSSLGEMSGSASAGCVEGAVVEEALGCLRDGRPRRLQYGVADDSAWTVGLACGGDIRLFVEPLASLLAGDPSTFAFWRSAVVAGLPVVRACVVEGPPDWVGKSWFVDAEGREAGGLPPGIAEAVRQDAVRLVRGGAGMLVQSIVEEIPVAVFLDVTLPAPCLILVGAVHIAVHLVHLAKSLGYRVVVVDPRRGFNTRERFPLADELNGMWPDEGLRQIGLTHSTAVAVLSHDPKIDDPALMTALRSPAFYVGALGSQRTNRLREERLRAAGMGDEEMKRLRAPIGLDLGGRAPEEIALSILSEIVAARAGSPLGARSRAGT